MTIKTVKLLGGLLASLAWGCGSPPNPATQTVEYPPISQSDAQVKAAKFVKELASVPANMRGGYVFTHIQEAHALGVSGDKKLQDQFRSLTRTSAFGGAN